MTEPNPPATASAPPMPPPPGPHQGSPEAASWSRRHTVWAWVLSSVGVLLVIGIVAGLLIHLPYVIISPGSATPLDRSVVQIKGATTYPHASDVRFLTVRVSTHDPSVWGYLIAKLDPDRDVEPRTNVVGCLTDTENESFNTQLMDQSQNDAKYVALTRLGYTVPAKPPAILVTEVCQGVPAYGKLHEGDRILAVGDHTIADISEVAPLVQQHRPGDPVRVTYQRNGTTGTTTVDAGRFTTNSKTGAQNCVPVKQPVGGKTTGTPCLGIATQQFVSYDFPIDIQINTDRVGGPSAGLAFTLAIIDNLTPGSLTGRNNVAVTGEINPDGSVSEVGGVEQKAITARANGVQLMIVPKQEVKDARRGAGNLHVVGVSTVDEALAALAKAGGSSVPPPSAAAARS